MRCAVHHARVEEFPDWWRGVRPPPAYDGPRPVFTGPLFQLDLDGLPSGEVQLRPLRFFRARARGLEIDLSDGHLSVRWSEFDRCHFRQRVRPVRNASGDTAQGSLGRPAIYRDCVFERVRFKGLGGYSLGHARFERCVFLDCRWEGHFAHHADLVDCTFEGKMNGCVWFGEGDGMLSGRRRRNEIRGNDFTRTRFTDNVAWRYGFPLDDQAFPEGFEPRVDF